MCEKEFAKKVGYKIGHYRGKLGISQEKLAEKVEVDRNTITRYENGQREPQLHVLVKIAKILNVQITELLPK